MCGRATLSTPARILAEAFGLSFVPELAPRYNVAPTQPVAVMRTAGQLELLRWGLVLPAGGVKGIGINVRVESAARVPAYRGPMRTQRCLVLVDGFYEWKREGAKKEPWHIHYPDARPFALGGIWARAENRNGVVVESCAILTGAAKGVVAALHDRMPLLVDPAAWSAWLDPEQPAPKELLSTHDDGLVANAVDSWVNDSKHEDARCIVPVESQLPSYR